MHGPTFFHVLKKLSEDFTQSKSDARLFWLMGAFGINAARDGSKS
jgi:hypothetical protein